MIRLLKFLTNNSKKLAYKISLCDGSEAKEKLNSRTNSLSNRKLRRGQISQYIVYHELVLMEVESTIYFLVLVDGIEVS